jgi:aldehyde:ferredoxin oxidoreductase
MAISSSTQTLFGYHGRYLHFDLSKFSFENRPLRTNELRRFIGGSGLGTYLLLKHRAAELDPLAPEAPIVLALSPFAGSPLTTTAKLAVVSKSPLTGRINDSLISGGFALAAKNNGCDAILIQGKAPRPSILVIDNGQARLEPAGRLWGQSCDQAQQTLQDRYGKRYEILTIGPAGENQVWFATISHARRHAGRGGSGAILGAKNLKAILVRGSTRCQWAHPEQLQTTARDLSRRSMGPATTKYRELGTMSNLLVFNRLHALPTHNFQQGSMANINGLSPESLAVTRTKTRTSCVACTIGCEHLLAVHGDSAGKSPADGRTTRVEYENLFALGPLCGINDPQVTLEASRRCDDLGLDTISTGGTIAFAMECVDRQLLDVPWLRFGSGEALLRAIDGIACRNELGSQLARGSRHLAQQLGGAALDLAPQVKGLELPGYEPRSMQNLALGLAVATRGADHNRTGAAEVDFSQRADRRHLTPASAELVVETENRAVLFDSLILCRFLRNTFDDFLSESADMLNLVTGWTVDAGELARTASRIVTARKLFNVRAGWHPEEDNLPARFLEQALPDDPEAKLSRDQLQAAIEAYNVARGWDTAGWIPTKLLQDLELDHL